MLTRGGRVREKFDKIDFTVQNMCVLKRDRFSQLCHKTCFSALNYQKALKMSYQKVFFLELKLADIICGQPLIVHTLHVIVTDLGKGCYN